MARRLLVASLMTSAVMRNRYSENVNIHGQEQCLTLYLQFMYSASVPTLLRAPIVGVVPG